MFSHNTHASPQSMRRTVGGVQSDINSLSRLSAIILSLKPVLQFLCVCIFQIRIFNTPLCREDTNTPSTNNTLPWWRGTCPRECCLAAGMKEVGEGEGNAMATDQATFNGASGCCIKGELLWERWRQNTLINTLCVFPVLSLTQSFYLLLVKNSDLSVQIRLDVCFWTAGLSCGLLMNTDMSSLGLWRVILLTDSACSTDTGEWRCTSLWWWKAVWCNINCAFGSLTIDRGRYMHGNKLTIWTKQKVKTHQGFLYKTSKPKEQHRNKLATKQRRRSDVRGEADKWSWGRCAEEARGCGD